MVTVYEETHNTCYGPIGQGLFLLVTVGSENVVWKDFFTTLAVSVATIKLTDEDRKMPCFKTMPLLAFLNKGITITLLVIVS